jgi:hypothetical protein
MMDYFLIFIAPFVIVISGIAVAFWVVLKDDAVREKEQ